MKGGKMGINARRWAKLKLEKAREREREDGRAGVYWMSGWLEKWAGWLTNHQV